MPQLSFYLNFDGLQKQALEGIDILEQVGNYGDAPNSKLRAKHAAEIQETLDVYHDVLLALLKKDVTIDEARKFLSMDNNAHVKYRNTYVRILPG